MITASSDQTANGSPPGAKIKRPEFGGELPRPKNAAKLKVLRDKFPQVQFWMLNANTQDDRASIVEEANDFEFSIPPQDSNHSTLAVYEFPKDTIIYDLAPHMHKRGSWFRYEALYPDGKHEVLLSVPRYNFNWQSGYRFAQPKHVSAGTRILCTGGFDNSKFNPDNLDPAKSVHWGDQSFEEMFIGFMTVSDAAPRAGTGSQHAQVTENARLPQ